MFLNTLINYCNSLQTQTKVAISCAAAVCGATFAYWYFAKRCENDVATELQSVERKNSANTNGKQSSCVDVHSRQQKKSDHALQVEELVCAEFSSRQQVNGNDNSSCLGTKQPARVNTEFQGDELNGKQQSVTTELEVEKNGLEIVSVSSLIYSPFDRYDSSADDVPDDNVKEQQVVPDEDETLFLDAAAWRDKETDEEIDFLTWVQSVEEGKTSHVESKVNLNRQRYRLSREREAEVKRLYETCKENAYDYESQCKTSAGGVRYGHSTFKLGDEEPYKPEDFDALLARRQPQYVFLDDDDVVDVTDRPDLQEQFLQGADLETKESDSSDSSDNETQDDRDFGYLDDLLSDDEENRGSEPQRMKENSATGLGFQGPGCFEEDERDFSYLDDILNEEDEMVDEEENSNSPRGVPATPDGHALPQCNNYPPQWTPFGESHLDPLLASQGEPREGYNIPDSSYGSPWQQQGPGHERFGGNGACFSQPVEFARTVPGPQWKPADHRPGYAHPRDY